LLIVALVACLGVSNAQQVRTIRGTVRDENGRGLSGAVVQLEDKTTLRIRSYVTEKDGGYHFAELPPDLSYHLRARYAGVFSERKISSRFDTRKEDVVNLTIHLSK
jgi:hypothetical protein